MTLLSPCKQCGKELYVLADDGREIVYKCKGCKDIVKVKKEK
jgi:hypothetical protein